MVRVHGTFGYPHDLKIELFHDFETAPSHTEYFDMATVLGLISGTREQVSIHVPRQRCESVRVRLTTTGAGRQAMWESIAFEVGKEPGLAPLAIPARR
jgi:hypothetical protein